MDSECYAQHMGRVRFVFVLLDRLGHTEFYRWDASGHSIYQPSNELTNTSTQHH